MGRRKEKEKERIGYAGEGSWGLIRSGSGKGDEIERQPYRY